MISAFVKLFVTLFVVVPVKLMTAGIKVGVGLLTAMVKLITLPIRIIF